MTVLSIHKRKCDKCGNEIDRTYAITVVPKKVHWCQACSTKYIQEHYEKEFGTPCESVIRHGPGHQSKTNCQIKGKHIIHYARYGSYQQDATWKGKEVSTGYFDEPPDEPEGDDK